MDTLHAILCYFYFGVGPEGAVSQCGPKDHIALTRGPSSADFDHFRSKLAEAWSGKHARARKITMTLL